MTATPVLDPRSYQDLSTRRSPRIPVHNPEWTNFNRSDPGVTLLELFAFLTESLLYRANQIPERNRRKFLSLLGVRGSGRARRRAGIVTIAQRARPADDRDARRRASRCAPARCRSAPSAASTCCRSRARASSSAGRRRRSRAASTTTAQLYASLRGERARRRRTCGSTRRSPLADARPAGRAGCRPTADNSLWIALLLRERRRRRPSATAATRRARARRAHADLGVVPGHRGRGAPPAEVGSVPRGSDRAARLPDPAARRPAACCPTTRSRARRALPLPAGACRRPTCCVEPGIVQSRCPSGREHSALWAEPRPARGGRGDFPPEPRGHQARGPAGHLAAAQAAVGRRRPTLLWVGHQRGDGHPARARRAASRCPTAPGEPDQVGPARAGAGRSRARSTSW